MSCKCDTINIVNDNNVIVVSHADGRDGKSAYQQAVEGGYTGTEQEFNCSLSLLADVADGKKQISDAINTKGGNSTPDESFQQLAEDIRNIDWNPNVGMVFVEGYCPKTLIEWLSSARNYLLEVNDNTLTELPIGAFSNCPNLHTVNLYALNVIVNYDTIRAIVYNNANLKTVYIPLCVTFNIAQGLDGAAQGGIQVSKELNITIPNCTSFITSYMGRQNNYLLQSIIVGSLTTFNNTYVNQQYLMRNITIGQDTNIDLNVSFWDARSVIAEGQSGIDELNENLYNNLLTKLYDHSEDGQTRTLRLGWLAKVSQENIDYANSKGWTLTT
jgi:hypothetical protein